MKVNWKVRFKNKVWLTMFFSTIITFVYTILGMLDIAPHITQNTALSIVNEALMMLSLIGVIIDPTTSGIGDSERALGYEEPWVDEDVSEDGVG